MPVTPVTLDAPQAQAGSEHGYCGDMAEMTFIKPFLFTHPDHTREQFAARTCRVPVEVATHWFALAHTDTPLPNVPAPGTPAFAEARRAELMSSTARLFEQQQHDMMAASQVNRKAIEETVRMEAKETIKAELMVQMQAEFDRKLAEAVAKTKAELSGPADGADADADKAGGKKGK